MDKILLILKREYISRVKKKSFLLATFLLPILMGGIYALSIYLSIKDSDEEYVIKVLDESGYLANRLEDEGVAKFEFVNGQVDSVKTDVEQGRGFAFLHIPKTDLYNMQEIELFTMQTPGFELEGDIDDAIEKALETAKMENLGLNETTLDSIRTRISIVNRSLSGEASTVGSSVIANVVGPLSGFLIYIFILVYGTQVMRAVMQEKTSKIAEILVSSVKPFQLMMGKIIGVALVGLTQFFLWILLSLAILSLGPMLLDIDPQVVSETAETITASSGATDKVQALEAINKINEVLGEINLPLIIGAFIYFFLTGYLFNAALFAMVGSAVDSEADTQQFMLPIMLPVVLSMMMTGVVLKDPNGDIAFWFSMIPFSAPIIMMVRLPFDVPTWQLILSMALMIVGFVATTWMAGRVYRIGILMHGAKVNYKVIFKWLISKD